MKNFFALVLICSLFSCAEAPETAKTQESTKQAAHIAWFEGSVEEAFEAAEKQNKPLFLYWGAVWFPPCQEIKHTVFKSRRFIAQTESFIPVYLDGDTKAAQLNPYIKRAY